MVETVLYESKNPLREDERFIAFLVGEVYVTEKNKKTGEKRNELLPVRFSSSEGGVAEDKARAFWHYETAQKQAKIDRGKKLAARNRDAS